MGWQTYELDRIAQNLVLEHRDILNESHKMRETAAFGLERFWGEHLRHWGKEQNKANYWKDTWDELVKLMHKAGLFNTIDLVDKHHVEPQNTSKIKSMARQIWQLEPDEQRVGLAVLIQLCDCLVWWTQRYKVKGNHDNS
jgi:hypothetical protein